MGATIIGLRDDLSTQSRLLLMALCGAALCVLVITCANLANLLLARSLARQKEFSIRVSLGANRRTLLRQLLTESAVARTGGRRGRDRRRCRSVAVACAADAAWTSHPGGPAAGYANAAAGPGTDSDYGDCVRRCSRDTSVQKCGIQRTSRRRAHWRHGPSSIAVGAGDCGSGGFGGAADFVGLADSRAVEGAAINPGFRTEGVLTLRTALPLPKYDKVSVRKEFYTKVLTEVRRLPGVTDAAYISALPMVWRGGIWPVLVDGRSQNRTAGNSASLRYVTPGFFATLGIPVSVGPRCERIRYVRTSVCRGGERVVCAAILAR